MNGVDLKCERCHERSNDDKTGSEDHAALSREFVGIVAKSDDTDDRADEQGIRDSSLNGRRVYFGTDQMVENDIGVTSLSYC